MKDWTFSGNFIFWKLSFEEIASSSSLIESTQSQLEKIEIVENTWIIWLSNISKITNIQTRKTRNFKLDHFLKLDWYLTNLIVGIWSIWFIFQFEKLKLELFDLFYYLKNSNSTFSSNSQMLNWDTCLRTRMSNCRPAMTIF